MKNEVRVNVWMYEIGNRTVSPKEYEEFRKAKRKEILRSLSDNTRHEIGCLSIETSKFYATFWPNDFDTSKTGTFICESKLNSQCRSVDFRERECDAEEYPNGRMPYRSASFSTLNVDDIESCLLHCMHKKETYYSLDRTNTDSGYTEDPFSLVYEILTKNGACQLSTISYQDLARRTVTPDDFISFLKEAKQRDSSYLQKMKFLNLNGLYQFSSKPSVIFGLLLLSVAMGITSDYKSSYCTTPLALAVICSFAFLLRKVDTIANSASGTLQSSSAFFNRSSGVNVSHNHDLSGNVDINHRSRSIVNIFG